MRETLPLRAPAFTALFGEAVSVAVRPSVSAPAVVGVRVGGRLRGGPEFDFPVEIRLDQATASELAGRLLVLPARVRRESLSDPELRTSALDALSEWGNVVLGRLENAGRAMGHRNLTVRPTSVDLARMPAGDDWTAGFTFRLVDGTAFEVTVLFPGTGPAPS